MSKKRAGEARHLLTADLRARGWTAGLIERFYPEPAGTRPNPHYSKAAPMKLYCPKRVEQIETTKTFRLEFDRAQARKASAARAVQTKRARMEKLVEKIDVPLLPREELIRQACAHYNSRSFGGHASPSSSGEFLDRICVNYLRHRLTDYEKQLREVSGKVGASDWYAKIKKRVLDAIAEKYDWLQDKCDAQVPIEY